ncbi:MAG: hypothetical protein A2270_05790 [Elusimicrobia bacterium RIFOXYA12_FULL_51_18]|nr:MAG: hypothetical protein A2270_05790 [Elusimicrobia bacterium RIFOXYA12_FULL_51_18]OGS31563.1 MAG: hypothetical protein A2218_03530 [Elusimicrobia bacterium RIFOXYA2_FULL_53_38]
MKMSLITLAFTVAVSAPCLAADIAALPELPSLSDILTAAKSVSKQESLMTRISKTGSREFRIEDPFLNLQFAVKKGFNGEVALDGMIDNSSFFNGWLRPTFNDGEWDFSSFGVNLHVKKVLRDYVVSGSAEGSDNMSLPVYITLKDTFSDGSTFNIYGDGLNLNITASDINGTIDTGKYGKKLLAALTCVSATVTQQYADIKVTRKNEGRFIAEDTILPLKMDGQKNEAGDVSINGWIGTDAFNGALRISANGDLSLLGTDINLNVTKTAKGYDLRGTLINTGAFSEDIRLTAKDKKGDGKTFIISDRQIELVITRDGIKGDVKDLHKYGRKFMAALSAVALAIFP